MRRLLKRLERNRKTRETPLFHLRWRIHVDIQQGSIIQYARPADLKLELNDHFRQTHPEIDPTITLSKIRSVKTRLLAVGQELDLEISSIAKSFAYFEKLVLKVWWSFGKDAMYDVFDGTRYATRKWYLLI